MARILLTGNRGFFGTRFHALYDRYHTILGIDKDDVDIVDAAAVTAAFREFRPELVIHAAAITATDFSDKYPELTRSINIDGAVNVATAAREVGAKLIFFSTEQVFNANAKSGPYSEEDIPQPDTMYGITKLEAEKQLRTILEELWVLRFTWLFGLPERNMPVNPNILWNAIQIALRGERTAVPVNEYRGHTYGFDMLEAIIRIPEIPYGTYHIGSTNDLGRYEITQHILRELGLSSDRIDELISPDREKYAARSRDVRLATERIAQHGITFETSVEATRRALREYSLHGAV
ncbi:MAG: sugar nucleotide-binding protein [Spirochaeta sp.]|jgi:dTDP-4-dehydrorhamnose reductase|nr:sugar nucleotide-binding protein [Spirochaeta sp.]